MRHPGLGLTAAAIVLVLSTVAATTPGEIHDLINAGDMEGVRAMLEVDPSLVAARDEFGDTPLHVAASRENLAIATLLIESRAEVDARNDRERTPLWLAASSNESIAVLELLLDHGADVNTAGFLGQTILEATILNQNEAAVDLVLAGGAVVPTDTRRRYRTMYLAAISGIPRVFEMMFELVPPLDPTGEDARGFLRGAAEGGSGPIVEQLLATGIDPNQADAYQTVPIHTTSQNGFLEATVALVSHGSDMNRRDAMGRTPYNLALANGHSDLVARLAEMGADTNPPQPPVLRGDYLGDTPPGPTPTRFATGIVSRSGAENVHATPVFSRDGNEVYWSDGWQAPISFMRRVEGVWTMPAHVPFTTGFIDDVPMFSPDESRLYFLSSMPVDDRPATDREFLWYVERDNPDAPWSDPIPGPAVINEAALHWQFAISPNGDIYVPTRTEESLGTDIHRSRLVNGEYQALERLEGPVNSEGDDHMPFVAPDGSYLVFAARNRPGGHSNFKLHISFRTEDGLFGEPVLLSDEINGDGGRICPVITTDGRYLFYLVGTDVRWVSTEFIEDLRP